MDPVSQLRSRLLPILRKWEQQLRMEHTDLTVNVLDGVVASLTDYQCHGIAIECLLKNPAPEYANNVALDVSVKHSHKTPVIDAAEVAWGHPSAEIEADILMAPVEYSAERLDEIVGQLPELFDGLQRAILRGCPET
jgi:hypothetical protein